jgi:hypothetical protein
MWYLIQGQCHCTCKQHAKIKSDKKTVAQLNKENIFILFSVEIIKICRFISQNLALNHEFNELILHKNILRKTCDA